MVNPNISVQLWVRCVLRFGEVGNRGTIMIPEACVLCTQSKQLANMLPATQ